VKLLPSLLAAGWVYKALKITQKSGGLLLHRFTITDKSAVYSLLHYPLGYPSHYLNGTILHSSPDFPLDFTQAIVWFT
jgi:hypothetical protein